MERTRNFLIRRPFLIAALLAFTVGACSLLAWSLLRSGSRDDDWIVEFKPKQHAASFAVPGSDFEIENARIATHPFLAEYDRIITYIKNGERGASHPLDLDVGGGYSIHCYLLEENGKKYVYLRDRISKHLLDLENQVTYVIIDSGDPVEMIDSGYLVKVDPASLSSGDIPTVAYPVWAPDPEAVAYSIPVPDDVIARVNEEWPFGFLSPQDQVETNPLESVISTTEGEYLGRFDGRGGVFRFIPASEEPEANSPEPSPTSQE